MLMFSLAGIPRNAEEITRVRSVEGVDDSAFVFLPSASS